jgi:hypothetical protein
VFESRLESFQRSFTEKPYLYHALFKFKDVNQGKSMGGKWGKRADFDLDDWYNKLHRHHNVPIEFDKSEAGMDITREQVMTLVSNMNIAFDSLRETLLSMEYQGQIFGKGKKVAFGEEGFLGEVLGDFDKWLGGDKSKPKSKAEVRKEEQARKEV